MEFVILLSLLVNFVVIQSRSEVYSPFSSENHTHLDIYANAIGRGHYNPWTCSYRSEPGYKCLSCTAALHCYPANFALLVQCAGFLPYCRNGYCSRFKSEGCHEEYTFSEGTHGPLRVTTTPSNNTVMINNLSTNIPQTTSEDNQSGTAYNSTDLIVEEDNLNGTHIEGIK